MTPAILILSGILAAAAAGLAYTSPLSLIVTLPLPPFAPGIVRDLISE